MITESDLIERDGTLHCPRDDCDWQVPAGMGYLVGDHNHNELDELTDDALERFAYRQEQELLAAWRAGYDYLDVVHHPETPYRVRFVATDEERHEVEYGDAFDVAQVFRFFICEIDDEVEMVEMARQSPVQFYK